MNYQSDFQIAYLHLRHSSPGRDHATGMGLQMIEAADARRYLRANIDRCVPVASGSLSRQSEGAVGRLGRVGSANLAEKRDERYEERTPRTSSMTCSTNSASAYGGKLSEQCISGHSLHGSKDTYIQA